MPTCSCGCHQMDRADAAECRSLSLFHAAYVFAQRAHRYEGVSVTDAFHAVTACARCVNAHVPALLPKIIWGPEPREKADLPPELA